jgi:hypothetical protein
MPPKIEVIPGDGVQRIIALVPVDRIPARLFAALCESKMLSFEEFPDGRFEFAPGNLSLVKECCELAEKMASRK